MTQTMNIDGERTASFRDEQGNAVDAVYPLDGEYEEVVVRHVSEDRITLKGKDRNGDTTSLAFDVEEEMYKAITPIGGDRRDVPDDLLDVLFYVGCAALPELTVKYPNLNTESNDGENETYNGKDNQEKSNGAGGANGR